MYKHYLLMGVYKVRSQISVSPLRGNIYLTDILYTTYKTPAAYRIYSQKHR